jgi:tetratricopeptide (TPR) repeat protein
MAGEGFTQLMNSIIRNNKSMLRKKNFFNKDKYYKAENGKLESKEISTEDKEIIRKKVSSDRKKENFKIFGVISLLIISIFFFINHDEGISDKDDSVTIQSLEKNKFKKYKGYINLGDKMILKQNWKNAIKYYEQAYSIYTDKYSTNYKLTLAYSYNCKYNDLDCEKSELLLERLIDSFPSSVGGLGTIYLNLEK